MQSRGSKETISVYLFWKSPFVLHCGCGLDGDMSWNGSFQVNDTPQLLLPLKDEEEFK